MTRQTGGGFEDRAVFLDDPAGLQDNLRFLF